ncbi:QWRF motif-containing protein 7 [Tripterygium wilfordii]|uniref:QWRF motif-containing protein 7 n=1 Tax=Tripterygium wilfordii TaxID=458696 RepID=UPI0018F8562D|nr:QWRF motif-containing protein 7 [Tripterygium wilfordii]
MESTRSHSRSRRFHPPPPTPPRQQSPSPKLLRSRSGSENKSISSLNSSQRFTGRSQSTSKSRIKKNGENPASVTIDYSKSNITLHCSTSPRDGFVRFLRRGSESNSGATKKAKSSAKSPSAWALSPGRSSPRVSPLESSVASSTAPKGKSGSGGGVSGVLRYFNQKKVSKVQEGEYHRFRVLHSRLCQWRFVNAKAESAMDALNIAARDKILGVWLRLFKMRNSIKEKQIHLQKLKHNITLDQILLPQLYLLNEWAKLEGRNCEAVSRLATKLSGLSLKIPLVHGAKADSASIYEAMSTALKVMDDIETTVNAFFSQVEKILFLVTELMSALEHGQECLEDTQKLMAMVAALGAREMSVRVHLIQATSESRGDN